MERKLGERVVLDLTRELVGKSYKIFFDNYFSSVDLLVGLYKENIFACGTIGKNRQSLPDSRSILFISSFHDPYIIQKINCKHKEDDGISIKEIPCPKLEKDYNQYMGDVEKQEVVATHILQGGQMKLKDFRIAIAAGLIGAAFEQKRGRPSATKAENKYKRRILHEKRYSEAAHLPEFGTKRRCNFCSTKKDVKISRVICSECKIAL
ncbi:hypothetical protein ILUMI_14629 [Ignelater luminosus]|uniref:PiggyBac transposable element-derived protein domain-containing protein n=1 Tax=Ignelater luminosus TaxID=2038154 RepID=A0A8K0CS41_IGNLU|nr:hypothetical protein ILUMI_14629 [Ignelater luminosus]